MIVMVLENTPTSLRGELTRWLLEPRAGVFVGHVTATVRERLWTKCCETKRAGGVLQIWSTNSAQRYRMRACGKTQRRLTEVEGLHLVQLPAHKQNR